MRRTYWTFCLLLALSLLAPVRAMPTRAAEPGPTANAPVPQPRWRAFAPPGGRFSVLLPATPLSRSPAAPVHTYSCSVNDARYFVQYDDRPADDVKLLGAEKMLQIAGDVFLKATQGTLIRRSRLTRKGLPGIEIVALRPRGRQETIRAFVIGNRVYHLAAVTPAGDAAAGADANKFLDSFTPDSLPSPVSPAQR